MSYIDKHLMAGERVLYRTKPHYIVYTPCLTWLVITGVLLIVGPTVDVGRLTIAGGPPLARIAGAIAFLFTLYTGLRAYIYYLTSDYCVSNKRVLMKTGLIQRTSLEILLQRIESIHVTQSIPGRLLNYGIIIVSGTGGSKDPFDNIPSPLTFRQKIQEQIESAIE